MNKTPQPDLEVVLAGCKKELPDYEASPLEYHKIILYIAELKKRLKKS